MRWLAAILLAAPLLLPAALGGAGPDANPVVVRLHGDGRIGEVCRAQSECGYRQRCVYRGEDLRSPGLRVESGKCEANLWTGGCFGSLPLQRFSKAEQEAAPRKGQAGLPVELICH